VIWEEDGHNHLRPKSRGRSQHASGFCCPCHGFIEDDGPEDDPAATECCSFHIITPGKNDDGYWTNDDLVKQLDKVIPLFERWHPDCQLLFLFDNSGNHHKRAPDGLCAQTMNLKDGGKNAPRQRNATWDGQPQLMTLPDGTPKGLRTVLMERGGWVPGMSVAEARAAVADYPDFRAQKEWLRETVENTGHLIDYYPKFHCELNYIEMVWAYCKAKLRRSCPYNFHDLVVKLPETLHDVPLPFHRRALTHCFRFMSGYRRGLKGPMLDYVLKKYKGHRVVPQFAANELVNIEGEYKQQRDKLLKAKLEACK
jgi:hypothetical protein